MLYSVYGGNSIAPEELGFTFTFHWNLLFWSIWKGMKTGIVFWKKEIENKRI